MVIYVIGTSIGFPFCLGKADHYTKIEGNKVQELQQATI